MFSKKLIYLSSVILILIMLAAVLLNQYVSADETLSGAEPYQAKKEILDIGGEKREVILQSYQKDSSNKHFLLLKRSLFQYDRIELIGFEYDLDFCPQKTVMSKSKETIICLVSEVGVHSQNLNLVKISRNQLSLVKFRQNDTSSNIFSDVPNINFEDFDSDGFSDLIIDNRDYETDPLTKSIRSYYKNSNSGFIFDRNEKIDYNTDSSN